MCSVLIPAVQSIDPGVGRMTHGTPSEEHADDSLLLATASSSVASTAGSSSLAVKTPIDPPLPHNCEIELTKDDYGFGFNVVGGTDSEHLPGDPGIFVSVIREDGVAKNDGRLKQGDKILSVNGVDITSVSHDEAVRVLRQVEQKARLVIQSHAEADILAQTVPEKKEKTPQRPQRSNDFEEVDRVTTPSKPNGHSTLSATPLDGAMLPVRRGTTSREEDEESLYAPSTHSIIYDVPRTPRRRPPPLYERPYVAEALYVSVGAAAVALFSFMLYKVVSRSG